MAANTIYSIVLESIDGGVASAVLLSVRDEAGNVVKRTAADGNWCIFRTTIDQDAVEYVNKASVCRKCLSGVEFQD